MCNQVKIGNTGNLDKDTQGEGHGKLEAEIRVVTKMLKETKIPP